MQTKKQIKTWDRVRIVDQGERLASELESSKPLSFSVVRDLLWLAADTEKVLNYHEQAVDYMLSILRKKDVAALLDAQVSEDLAKIAAARVA